MSRCCYVTILDHNVGIVHNVFVSCSERAQDFQIAESVFSRLGLNEDECSWMISDAEPEQVSESVDVEYQEEDYADSF